MRYWIVQVPDSKQVWPYLRNIVLFFVVTPPAMVLTRIALQFMVQYSPPSFKEFLLPEMKRAYFISLLVGPVLSVIHTYLLRHTQVDSARPNLRRPTWYATLLGLLATLSLLRFLALGYDAILYFVPGTLCYGMVTGWVGGGALQDLPRNHGYLPQKHSVLGYLLNAAIFVTIAAVVTIVGLWISLRSGIIGGLFVAGPFFLFILAVFFSFVHTYLLWEISGTSSELFRRRSMGLASGLALLVCAVYLLYGQPEFNLFFAAALIYGWLIGRLFTNNEAAPEAEISS